MFAPKEVRNYRDWLNVDTELWRHYWFGMVNRGVMAQPYWWDEQWTMSVQHTEADIDKHLAAFEDIAPALAKAQQERADKAQLWPRTRNKLVWGGHFCPPRFRRDRNADDCFKIVILSAAKDLLFAYESRAVINLERFSGIECPTDTQADQPHLKRVLGRWDLVLLFVVAVFNLNVVPSIAANGGVTVWLWLISLLLFFWPQGIAVIELAHRYPGEGGVYLWAKEVFGDFHGFLSGWCYWTNNMLYVPTVMLYFVGVSVFALGPGHQRSRRQQDTSRWPPHSSLLALLTILNIVGLGVGKWLNNIGAIGTGIAAAVLIGLGLTIYLRFGTTVTAADFRIPADPRFVLNSFGVICFGLVGLELASVMGDEIRDPQRTLPGAVAWGGVLSGVLYIGATLTLLVAVRKNDISVLQGIVQAVSHMAAKVGVGWIIAPFALDAQLLDCGHRLGLDGRVGAHSLRRRARFLHASRGSARFIPSTRHRTRR